MDSINYINIIRETSRLIIRPMREKDFEAIRNGLNGQYGGIS